MTNASEPWRISAATAADLKAIAALEAAAFSQPWTLPLLQEEFAQPSAILLTARARDGLTLAAYAAFRLGPGEGELLRIASAPRARGRGAAHALLAAGLSQFLSAGCCQCHLEVRADNASAIRLYERVGFERLGVRRSYYSDGANAITFALTLGGDLDAR